jgi:hypothetical protein
MTSWCGSPSPMAFTEEMRHATTHCPLSGSQSADRRVMNPKRPRYISQCFARLSSCNRLALLMAVQLKGPPHMHPSRLRANATLASP